MTYSDMVSDLLILPPSRPVEEANYQRLLGQVRRGRVMVLTGAGMSTASGIPDYRGPDGQRRVTPMQYGEFLADEHGRRRYWSRAYAGWTRFEAAGPNEAHESLTALQGGGLISGIVTQNVDGLHQRAGATGVVELHGNLARVVCLDCAATYPREVAHEWLTRANPDFKVRVAQVRPDGDVDVDPAEVADFVLAKCPRCRSSKLKPDVVFFGGSVPSPLVSEAFDILDQSDSLLVIGSSLQVMSGYRFVRKARKFGKQVAILTRGATRGDADADIKIDALLADVLPRLVSDTAN